MTVSSWQHDGSVPSERLVTSDHVRLETWFLVNRRLVERQRERTWKALREVCALECVVPADITWRGISERRSPTRPSRSSTEHASPSCDVSESREPQVLTTISPSFASGPAGTAHSRSFANSLAGTCAVVDGVNVGAAEPTRRRDAQAGVCRRPGGDAGWLRVVALPGGSNVRYGRCSAHGQGVSLRRCPGTNWPAGRCASWPGEWENRNGPRTQCSAAGPAPGTSRGAA